MSATAGLQAVVVKAGCDVFFGYRAPEATGPDLELWGARMAVYYSSGCHGVLGLAAWGPDARSRISPAVHIHCLSDVTMIVEATPKAVQAWEAEPWDD